MEIPHGSWAMVHEYVTNDPLAHGPPCSYFAYL